MTSLEVIALIVSGVFVGFINTLAGGGTIISLSLFMFMGLPADIANGTNRIAVILQNLTSVSTFRQKKLLDTRKALWLSIPTVIGSLIGAQLSVQIDESTFRKAIAVVMLMMIVFILTDPDKWLKGQLKLQEKKVSIWQMLIFFGIGIYGGFVQVGVGYFLLAGIVLGGLRPGESQRHQGFYCTDVHYFRLAGLYLQRQSQLAVRADPFHRKHHRGLCCIAVGCYLGGGFYPVVYHRDYSDYFGRPVRGD